MSPSKILLSCLFSFVAGVFVASFINVPKFIIYEFFVLAVIYFVFSFFQKNQPAFRTVLVAFSLCLLFLGLGILRTEAGLNQMPSNSETRFNPSPQIENLLHPLNRKLRGLIYQAFSPPRSSILASLVIGDKKYIPDKWKEKLNRAGVRHITAVSGLHIVIVSAILLWLGIALGLYRGQAFYFALFFIWLFIMLIGFQPSAVRAGLMGSLLLFCQKIGRQGAADRALFLTAGLMLAFNPLLLRYSLGFQLSFLATLGIIYFMPGLERFFGEVKLLKISGVSGLLAMTFSAQIFVLPILIYNFGRFSLVSPITNVLIVPLLPFIMSLGIAFLIFNLIWSGLGFLVSLPLFLLLSYLVGVVDFFSRLPLANVAFSWSWIFIPFYYLALLGFNKKLFYNLKKEENVKPKQ